MSAGISGERCLPARHFRFNDKESPTRESFATNRELRSAEFPTEEMAREAERLPVDGTWQSKEETYRYRDGEWQLKQ